MFTILRIYFSTHYHGLMNYIYQSLAAYLNGKAIRHKGFLEDYKGMGRQFFD